jgi:hypothetical protein
MAKSTLAYKALQAAAVKHNAPKRYKEDLTNHDKNILSWFQGCFGWILRDSGTQIQLVDSSADIRKCQYISGYRNRGGWTYGSIFGDVIAIYFWDGYELIQLDSEEQLKHRLKKAWKQG